MPGRHAISDNGGGEDWSIVPMEKSLYRLRYVPYLLKILHKLAQSLHNEVGIHCGPPGPEVGVDEALVVEEDKDHLFGLAQMDLGLEWPRQALLKPIFGLQLGLRSVKGHYQLVYVTTLLCIPLERRRTIVKKALLVLTLSISISLVTSLGTHHADFNAWCVSLCRMLL